MSYHLDTEFDRQGTHSVKWEFIVKDGQFTYGDHADKKYGKERILPMWVADMDFRCPPAVIEALVKRAQHGIFGYTAPTDSCYEAVIGWMKRRYGWDIERKWITLSPGIVPAINMLVQSFIAPGEKVLIQRPVYYPFMRAIENNGGEIVSNSLLYENGRYRMDFDDLAAKTADPAVKMAILCSPHNPISRVWTRAELIQFGEICIENKVVIVSDEIHCDLIFSGQSFTAFASISDTFAQNSIICTAPSKTFNLAGLQTSNIIIQNEEWRAKFRKRLECNGLTVQNNFGIVALEAAYNYGETWLAEVMAYVEANYKFMAAYMAEHLPQVTITPPEATYLIWCDFKQLGLSSEARKTLMMEHARVYLDEGEMFGPEGEGFERFNLACPRSILAEALERIKTAVDSL
ncbi:MAG: cystathionine beta-lyase [Anaerolineaceae bacterium 4572_5.2]|nr:MAG: cystathionine beta-lyase [Anaerolineaceae bacterium 4572_5.2]